MTEEEKINRDHAIRAHDRNERRGEESRKAAIESASVAIRALLLVNGGAAVALLAFIGALKSGSNASMDLEPFVSSLFCFAGGVGLAALTSALAYLVNMLDADIYAHNSYSIEYPYVIGEPKKRKLLSRRQCFHWLAMFSAACTLIFFFLGVFSMRNAVLLNGL